MWEKERKIVLEASQRMAEKSFVVGTAGNVSMRLDTKDDKPLIAISPSTRYYETMTVDDIIIVDFDGQKVEGTLDMSIETSLHIAVFKARKKINAVIHFHPEFASVLSVMGQNIPTILDDQVQYLGGEIHMAEYALSGSKELVDNVMKALGPRNAALLANHGALALGRDMREAFTNCKMLEKTAKIYIYALCAGKVNLLPKDAMEAIQLYYDYHFGEN